MQLRNIAKHAVSCNIVCPNEQLPVHVALIQFPGVLHVLVPTNLNMQVNHLLIVYLVVT